MTTLVSVECHETMGRDRLARQPWSDVRISFIPEPGGETVEFEPTLVSRPRLAQDLQFERELEREYPERDRSGTIAKLEKIVELFTSGARFYIDSNSPEDTVPEIYTSQEYIDQEEAERMLAHFLGTLGFKEVGFQWIWPEFICSVG